MNSPITLTFHKININVNSAVPGFISFLSQYFSGCLNTGNTDKSNIELSFEFLQKKEYENIYKEFNESNSYSRLSRSLFVSGKTALFSGFNYLPGLTMKFRIEDDRLVSTADPL